MKKIFVTLFALLALALSLPAQNVRFSDDANLAFGNDVFVVAPISYLGFGYHLPFDGMRDEMKKAFNDEFFVNVMELGFRPFRGGMFTLGVDYDLDVYRMDKDHYFLPEATNSSAVYYTSIASTTDKVVKKSKLFVHTLSVPVAFELEAGKCAFRIGAAGEYNLPANIKNKVINAHDELVTSKYKGIKTQEFGYSLFGAISYGGLGVYVRYRPTYQFLEAGPQFKSLTVGAVLGLGM